MDEGKRVRELARAEGYHRGVFMTYEDVARHLPPTWSPRFIANQCELAGWPVWSSAPDEALSG
jgi:hypothetical protein